MEFWPKYRYTYINLVRLAGMYSAYTQGLLIYPPIPVQNNDQPATQHNTAMAPISVERREIIISKHEQRSLNRNYTTRDDIFLCDGGLLFVGNPYYYYDYNAPYTIDS